MAAKIGGKTRGGGKASPSAPPRDAKIGDNARAVDDAYASQLIGFVTKLRAQQGKIDAKKAELDLERNTQNDIFGLAKGAGFTRKRLTALLTDMAARHRDLQAEEEQRAKDRTILGLPAGSQLSLFENTPVEEKDRIAWKAEGYLAGMRGDDPTAPKECPARFTQAWLEGWHDGQAVIARSMTAPAPAAAPEPEPEEKEPTPADLRAQERRARESLENIPEGDDDGFEASEEELAGQILRPKPEGEPTEAVG